MPIYTYKCKNCDHTFDYLNLGSGDEPKCPNCNSTNVEQQISASNFQLKGGGWAKDKYGGSGRKGK